MWLIMNKKKKQRIYLCIAICLIIVVAVVIYFVNRNKEATPQQDSNQISAESGTIDGEDNIATNITLNIPEDGYRDNTDATVIANET